MILNWSNLLEKEGNKKFFFAILLCPTLTIRERYGVFVHVQFLQVCSRSDGDDDGVMVMMMVMV